MRISLPNRLLQGVEDELCRHRARDAPADGEAGAATGPRPCRTRAWTSMNETSFAIGPEQCSSGHMEGPGPGRHAGEVVARPAPTDGAAMARSGPSRRWSDRPPGLQVLRLLVTRPAGRPPDRPASDAISAAAVRLRSSSTCASAIRTARSRNTAGYGIVVSFFLSMGSNPSRVAFSGQVRDGSGHFWAETDTILPKGVPCPS